MRPELRIQCVAARSAAEWGIAPEIREVLLPPHAVRAWATRMGAQGWTTCTAGERWIYAEARP